MTGHRKNENRTASGPMELFLFEPAHAEVNERRVEYSHGEFQEKIGDRNGNDESDGKLWCDLVEGDEHEEEGVDRL